MWPFLEGGLDGQRVRVGKGKRLFHEDMDADGRAHSSTMRRCLSGAVNTSAAGGMSACGHLRDCVEVERGREMIFRRVRVEEALVGFDNPHELDVGALGGCRRQE